MTDPSLSTKWAEAAQDGEEEQFREAASKIRRLQERYARDGDQKIRRAFHVKSHAGLHAELKILHDIPEFARSGLFSKPQTYQAQVRFSNGFPGPQSDWRPDVRGMAVRILGANGPRLVPEMGEGRAEQDLIALNVPFIPFRHAGDFAVISTAATSNVITAPFKILRQMGIFRGLQVILWGFRLLRPIPSLATEVYWSNLPMTLGPHAVKFKWVPHVPSRRTCRISMSRNHFRNELKERLALGSIGFDLMVQFYASEETTPIENGAHEWKESDSPFLRLAELTIPSQDLDGDVVEDLEQALDASAFNPWNGIEAHRPLGNTQRARLSVYRASALHRGFREQVSPPSEC